MRDNDFAAITDNLYDRAGGIVLALLDQGAAHVKPKDERLARALELAGELMSELALQSNAMQDA